MELTLEGIPLTNDAYLNGEIRDFVELERTLTESDAHFCRSLIQMQPHSREALPQHARTLTQNPSSSSQ